MKGYKFFKASVEVAKNDINPLLNRDITGSGDRYTWPAHIASKDGALVPVSYKDGKLELLAAVSADDADAEETAYSWLDNIFGKRPAALAPADGPQGAALSAVWNENLTPECRWLFESPDEVREAARRAGVCGALSEWMDKTANCVKNAPDADRLCLNTVLIIDEETKLRNRYFAIAYRWLAAIGAVKDQVTSFLLMNTLPETMRETRGFTSITDAVWFPLTQKYDVFAEADRMYARIEKSPQIFFAAMTREHFKSLEPNYRFSAAFPFVCDTESGSVRAKETAMKQKILCSALGAYGIKLESEQPAPDLSACDEGKIRMMAQRAALEKLSCEDCDYTVTRFDLTGEKRTDTSEEFDRMVGLAGVKEKLREIAAFVRNRGADKLSSLHMVFTGSPGTGKTMTARLLGQMLYEEGAVPTNKFIEADRGAIVGQYVGESAQKVKAVIDSAMGGVLFIDEAYSLYTGGGRDYGAEVVAALVKAMEDHRRDLVCIFAGYTEPMQAMLDMNPGFRSRIQFYIDFPDYTESELMEIFRGLVQDGGYSAAREAEAEAKKYISSCLRKKADDFANARTVRTFFERICFKQALRGRSDIILPEDVLKAKAEIKNARPSMKRLGF